MIRIARRQPAARTSHKISRKTAVHTVVSTSLDKEARCDQAVAESERCCTFGYYDRVSADLSGHSMHKLGGNGGLYHISCFAQFGGSSLQRLS
jgi:hypothetical protein